MELFYSISRGRSRGGGDAVAPVGEGDLEAERTCAARCTYALHVYTEQCKHSAKIQALRVYMCILHRCTTWRYRQLKSFLEHTHPETGSLQIASLKLANFRRQHETDKLQAASGQASDRSMKWTSLKRQHETDKLPSNHNKLTNRIKMAT